MTDAPSAPTRVFVVVGQDQRGANIDKQAAQIMRHSVAVWDKVYDLDFSWRLDLVPLSGAVPMICAACLSKAARILAKKKALDSALQYSYYTMGYLKKLS